METKTIGTTTMRARAAELLANADKEDSIRHALANVECGVPLADIHAYELYGAVATLYFGRKDRYGKDADLTLADLAALLRSFAPAPVMRVHDGCVAFRPKIDEVPRGEIVDIAPYILEHEPAVAWDPWTTLRWWTVLNGAIYEIRAYLPRPLWPVASEPRAEYSRSGILTSLDATPLHRVGDFELGTVTRFASGSCTGPRRSVAFWTNGPEWDREPLATLGAKWPALGSALL